SGQRDGRRARHQVELVPALDPFGERQRARRIAGGGLRQQQRQRHKPSSPAIGSIASRTNSMWPSSSTPTSAAPFPMSSGLTFTAKPALFIFFLTDSTSTNDSFFSGVTSAQATRNPDSSSHAKSALAMSVSRGTPE